MPHLPAEPMLIATVTAFLASVYLVWKLVGAVMKVVFFLVAFAIGYVAAYGLGQFGGHPQQLWVYAGEALAFAWVVNLVRAKVAKVVGALLILGLGSASGWFGFASEAEQLGLKPKDASHASHPAR